MWQQALVTGLQTGLSPARGDLNIDSLEPTPTDYTPYYLIILVALVIAGGTVYLITKK